MFFLKILLGCSVLGARQCKFPFTYDGKTYSKCTSKNHVVPWCATELDDEGSMKNKNTWGNCDMATCEGDEPGDGTCCV